MQPNQHICLNTSGVTWLQRQFMQLKNRATPPVHLWVLGQYAQFGNGLCPLTSAIIIKDNANLDTYYKDDANLNTANTPWIQWPAFWNSNPKRSGADRAKHRGWYSSEQRPFADSQANRPCHWPTCHYGQRCNEWASWMLCSIGAAGATVLSKMSGGFSAWFSRRMTVGLTGSDARDAHLREGVFATQEAGGMSAASSFLPPPAPICYEMQPLHWIHNQRRDCLSLNCNHIFEWCPA